MKQPVHMKTTLRQALGRAVPGKLSGRRGVLAGKAPFNDFSRRKGTWDNEVATTGLQRYQRQRGNPSVAGCHRESTEESEVTNDN